MDDNIAAVDQNPVAARRAFQGDIARATGFKALAQMFGHGHDLAAGTPGGHDHVVRDRRFSGKGDGDNVFGLVAIE
jgi:hypothetical protein